MASFKGQFAPGNAKTPGISYKERSNDGLEQLVQTSSADISSNVNYRGSMGVAPSEVSGADLGWEGAPVDHGAIPDAK